jgi:heme A synthase
MVCLNRETYWLCSAEERSQLVLLVDIYSTTRVAIVHIIWLYITFVVVVISVFIIVLCGFIYLLLVTVCIMYSSSMGRHVKSRILKLAAVIIVIT